MLPAVSNSCPLHGPLFYTYKRACPLCGAAAAVGPVDYVTRKEWEWPHYTTAYSLPWVTPLTEQVVAN